MVRGGHVVKIPGWAYAGVGLAITLYSKFVESRTKGGNPLMGFFFWIGIAILVFGTFKLITQFLLKDKSPGPKGQVNPGQRPPEARDAIYCPRCNAKLDPRSRYCNWCGTKL